MITIRRVRLLYGKPSLGLAYISKQVQMISLNKSLVSLLALLVVFSVLTPTVAIAEDGVQNPSQINSDQVFEVSDDGQIEGWERAAYTLRTDDTDAPVKITPPSTVNGEELGSDESFTTSTDESNSNDGTNTNELIRDFDGDRNSIGVHNSGEDVTIAFDDGLAQAGDQLSDQDNVELVAARLTPEDGAGAPTTTSDARDLLSDVESANRNASFEMLIDDDGSLNGTGQLETTESFSEGHYVLFMAVKENKANGFETDGDNNISVDGDVVLIGTDQLTVQQGETTVGEPSDPDPGENLTFDVDATEAFGQTGGITHAVAVYEKSTFEDARFDLVVDSSQFGGDFSFTDDAQLEHSINEVNGVARVEDGATLNQNDLADGKISRPVTAGSAIDFFADEAGIDDPSTDPITAGGSDNSKYERIDASVTAVNGENADTTVSVDTFNNFSSTKYQYIVVSALDDNESRMSTATGTITLGGGGGGGGGSGNDGGDDDTADEETIIEPEVERTGDNVTVQITLVNAGETLSIDVNEQDTEANQGTALERLNVTSASDSGNVQISVSTSQEPATGTPVNDQTDDTLRYVEVNTQNLNEAATSQGTFTFRASQQRVQDRGISPENVQMYRFSDGSWSAIETEHLGGNRYEATTPGFSSFAIGIAQPSIAVTDASLDNSEIQAGESVDIETVLENSGDGEGTITLDITANGSTVATTNATVGANETVTETTGVTFDDAGSYDIAVNGESAGTLAVTDSAQTATEEDPSTVEGRTEMSTTAGPEETPDDDGGLPLIAIGIIVVLAAAAAIGYAYYNQS